MCQTILLVCVAAGRSSLMLYGLNQHYVVQFWMIKYQYGSDNYIVYNLSKKQRTLCAQLSTVCQPVRKKTRFV